MIQVLKQGAVGAILYTSSWKFSNYDKKQEKFHFEHETLENISLFIIYRILFYCIQSLDLRFVSNIARTNSGERKRKPQINMNKLELIRNWILLNIYYYITCITKKIIQRKEIYRLYKN